MTDPTYRVLTLLGLLESRVSWTGSELAKKLGVSPRTLRRDVDKLREFGYRVDADAGPGGGYVLGRGQVLPPLLLDDDQAVTIAVVLAQFAAAGNGEQAETALRALATIEAIVPPRIRHRLSALRETSLQASAQGSLTADVLLPCSEAIGKRLRIMFGYTDRYGRQTERKVEPHRLAARGGTWVLLAYDLDREDWRTFRVDRMGIPEIGTWHFTERSDIDQAVERLDQPIPPEAWRHQLRVRIHTPIEKAQHLIPGFAGHMTALEGDETEFLSGADDPDEAVRWLCCLPIDFEVLGDESMVAAAKRLGERLCSSIEKSIRES